MSFPMQTGEALQPPLKCSHCLDETWQLFNNRQPSMALQPTDMAQPPNAPLGHAEAASAVTGRTGRVPACP